MIRWSAWGSVFLVVLVRAWPRLVKYWRERNVGALLGVGSRLSQMVIRKYVRATGMDASEEEILRRAHRLLPDLGLDMDTDGPIFEGDVQECAT